MRLTFLRRRRTLAASVAVLAACVGCQRLPYIDQSKPVPHDALGTAAKEDKDVQQAAWLSPLPTKLPRVDPPHTTSNPESAEIWEMTLQEAIQIGLSNSEVVRVISLGAQGIPVGGFEPTPLNTSPGSALGAGTLTSVYDPAIQETQIAQALAAFDASLQSNLLWGRNEQLFNNAIQAGTFATGPRFPVFFNQQTAQYASTIQKRTASGATVSVAHNINWLYSNSPANVTPGAYTTNTQLRFSQPLLGSAPNQFNPNPLPSGLEANRAPIIIARLNADSAVWKFKAEIMAHVRSVEQQYWALAQQQVQYWSRETAVELGQEILRREQVKLEVGTGSVPNVAEAKESLQQFKLDLVQATADLVTTERQLRNVLGLKPSDNRRIVPITEPTTARLEPDWDASLGQMISFQPDIVQNQLFVRLAELQLLVARNQLLPVLNLDALYQYNGLGRTLDRAEAVMTGASVKAIDPLISLQQRNAGLNSQPINLHNFQTWQVGFTFQMPIGYRAPLANVHQAQYQLLRQRAFLQQVVHQTTHSLARFFLEVDSNYKLYKTAGLLREAAQERLEAQQAFYENGTITIDRYLDAVNRWANAVYREAQYKTTYNISIAALEEAKGTLLAYDNIAVAEGPQPRKAYIQARDQVDSHRRLPVKPDGPYHPSPIVGPPVPDPVESRPSPGLGPEGPRPDLPAPVGPLGPAPAPVSPMVPAGQPNTLSQKDAQAKPKLDAPETRPVSNSPSPAEGKADALPDLPPDGPSPAEDKGGALPNLPADE